MSEIEEIYQKYFKDVYRYALSLCGDESLAEEITQETFFKALKNLDNFNGDCTVYAWLCQIAKNSYFSLRRRSKKTTALPDEEETADNFVTLLCEKETAREIHRALHELPEPYKEVFSLHTFGELPFAQIAELFGKTEAWARVTYHRAKIKIKEAIK